MNRAIVFGYAESAARAIHELLSITELQENHFYHTAIGNFYFMNGEKDKAMTSYEKALSTAKSVSDVNLINRKIEGLEVKK